MIDDVDLRIVVIIADDPRIVIGNMTWKIMMRALNFMDECRVSKLILMGGYKTRRQRNSMAMEMYEWLTAHPYRLPYVPAIFMETEGIDSVHSFARMIDKGFFDDGEVWICTDSMRWRRMDFILRFNWRLHFKPQVVSGGSVIYRCLEMIRYIYTLLDPRYRALPAIWSRYRRYATLRKVN
ncbi:MAG: hypothetical protein NUV82_03805 [Candidatus Komeilibacteria bacterium]|nr:hypothetical protein [Candidatus Komeilibacteria bacterium]